MTKLTLVLASLCLIISSQAFAWGDLGHGTIGYMAEKYLTPRAKGFVYSILGAEPLMTASTWPDLVRDDPRYKPFAAYHFFDLPPGTTFETLKPEDRQPQDADILITKAPQLLRSPDIDQSQKIILLRYLIHVIEDVHQPLHVGNGVDMGANLCQVKWVSPSGTTIKNLHSIWDESLVNKIADKIKAQDPTIKYFGYTQMGDALLKENATLNINPAVVQKDKPIVWYTESRALHAVAYPDGDIDPKSRPYCKILDMNGVVQTGAFDEKKIPTLSSEYVAKATDVVKRRMLSAAFRLAAYLDYVAAGADTDSWNSKTDQRFFKPIMVTNSKSRSPQSRSSKKLPPFRDPHGQHED